MKKMMFVLMSNLFVCLAFTHISIASAQEVSTTSYIMVDMPGTSQNENLYIYNQGRLETKIMSDNSMINYSFDGNGNLLKQTKGYSAKPYLFSTSAVSYDIYIKGVPENIQQVHFPTWNELDAQAEWIVGEKITKGVWKGTVVFARHTGQIGTYTTHVYADGKLVTDLIAQVKDTVKTIAPQEASLVDGFYEVFVEGIARNVREVRFPTWTANEWQDDLVNPWIIGEKVNDTTWKIRVPFSKHNFEKGNYITHFYSFDKYGTLTLLGGTSVNVEGGTGGAKETDISGVSYDVFIYGLDSTVQEVRFPSWTANLGQDDIEWIEGVKVANGVWKGTVVYSKHNSEIGRYITHVYADGKLSGSWEFEVKQELKLKAPQEIHFSSGGFYEILVEGIPSNVTEVEFPTWTINNAQDDLVWGKGERMSQNSWRIRIPFSAHNNEVGSYVTHIYSHDSYGNSLNIAGFVVNVKK